MPVLAPAGGARVPGWRRFKCGQALAAGAASVLAHGVLVAAVLHPPAPAAPATAGHRPGWPVVAVALSGSGSATRLDRTIPTLLAAIPVTLRAPPALPALPRPALAGAPAVPAPSTLSTVAGAADSAWGVAPPARNGRPEPSAQDGLRMAHLQAVRVAQDQLALDLRTLAPAARECHEVAPRQLACDSGGPALPDPLLARLLFQAQQSRAVGLSGDRLEIRLGEGRVLAVSLRAN